MKDVAESSRYPFIIERRGGPLTEEDHKSLMKWALLVIENANKVLNYKNPEELDIAYKWVEGKAKVIDCMKASREIHKRAKDEKDEVFKTYLRAIGHTIATAHMADHCMGASLYTQKCFKMQSLDIEKERDIHYLLLSKFVNLSLKDEVINRLQKKETSFKLR